DTSVPEAVEPVAVPGFRHVAPAARWGVVLAGSELHRFKFEDWDQIDVLKYDQIRHDYWPSTVRRRRVRPFQCGQETQARGSARWGCWRSWLCGRCFPKFLQRIASTGDNASVSVPRPGVF